MRNENLIVAEQGFDGRWIVDGEIVVQSKTDLAGFAEYLAARRGGPRVRLVLFIKDEGSQSPQVISRTPRWVCTFSRTQALAYSAPTTWNSFLLIEDSFQERVSLAFRTPAELTIFKTEVASISGVECLAKSLGIQHCLWASSDEEQPGPPEPLQMLQVRVANQAESVIRGAVAYANEFSAIHEGVWCGSDGRSTMRVTKHVAYSVHRPKQGVFDIRDLTLRNAIGSRPILIVSDVEVANIYGRQWNTYAAHHLEVLGDLRIEISERSKTLQRAEYICEFALRSGLPRDGIMLAIGGGVTLDVAGLAAAVYRRGVGYMRVPTTLVGLADVAVGVKQGVNALDRKNVFGAFYAPLASVNDYRLLASLPKREIACGMAEIAKIALLRDASVFESLEKHAEELLTSRFQSPSGIAEDLGIRAELLMMEELAPNLFERNVARLVDFGHTFSPAIEARGNYQISHGNAVALDMIMSIAIGVRRGLTSPQLLRRVISLFERIGFSVTNPSVCTATEIWDSLDNIRLHRAGALNLVVVTSPGKPFFLNDLHRVELESAFDLMRDHAANSLKRTSERSPGYVRAVV